MPDIDRTSYNKAALPIGTGYDQRPKGFAPSSIIVHTTNGQRGSSFEAEARYIYRSPAIGAHDLVGKRGQIAAFLPPELRAWHAGQAAPAFLNSRSIGIECHLTPGEAWTQEMRDALTWRVQGYMQQYGIPIALVDTHRAVALPRGRKIDPSSWADPDFYAWRAALAGLRYIPLADHLRSYVVTEEVNVRQGAGTTFPVALGGTCVLPRGFTFKSDVVVQGQALASGSGWAHVVEPAPWGFVHTSCVMEVAP